MRLDGRRESTNVEDRRGRTVATAGGIGLGGLIIVGLITLLLGGDPTDVIRMAGRANQGQATTTQAVALQLRSMGYLWPNYQKGDSQIP